MPKLIPEFNADGLLPVGIHQASLEEFRERFAIFDRSDRRLRIYEQIEQFVGEAKKALIVKRVLVGGSFVTTKSEPNDFDSILVLDSTIVGTSLRPFEYNLVSRRMARRMFGGDVLPAMEGSEALEQYLKFFQSTRDGECTGIVEIMP